MIIYNNTLFWFQLMYLLKMIIILIELRILQLWTDFRISSGLQIKLKPYKLCNTIRADSRQHVMMSLRLNLLCPPLCGQFFAFTPYLLRRTQITSIFLERLSLAVPKLWLVFCFKTWSDQLSQLIKKAEGNRYVSWRLWLKWGFVVMVHQLPL